MTRTHTQFDSSKGLLILVIAVLVIIIGILAIGIRQVSSVRSHSDTAGVHTSLGALAYRFESETAQVRTDQTVVDLKNFLDELGRESSELGCDSVYHNVLLASADEQQVLLKYGCDYPGASMFAVNRGGVWSVVSPTNQFDMFGIPLCSHVELHAIASSIAPVCLENDTVLVDDYTYRNR